MKIVIEIGSCQKHFSANNGSTKDDAPSYLLIYLLLSLLLISFQCLIVTCFRWLLMQHNPVEQSYIRPL